jgi:hypothetical protein
MKRKLPLLAGCMILLLTLTALAENESNEPLIPELPIVPTLSVSTVPPNGDINPYGVAFVPNGFVHGGQLHAGNILVSNFNNSSNLQGTGTTIVKITQQGNQSVFFQGPQGLGLTTALGVLRRGLVLVGNVPTTDGSCATVQQGSILVIDRNGNQVDALSDSQLLDGPWFLTIHDQGEHAQIFVSNVLSGAVTRLNVRVAPHGSDIIVESATQIASGYLHRCDPAALVVGPTGLVYDAHKDILYVASTGDNEIFAVHHAGTTNHDHGMGQLIYTDSTHLHGPLALVRAPNGDLVTSNGDAVNPDPNQPSEIVEFTIQGQFVAQFSVDSAGEGGAFGIALFGSGDHLRFAAVDDIQNVLDVWDVE